ncbi:MAG: hypothetical protein R3D44_07825 [Hyphomicrobiaceae bacterium]
MPSEEKQHPEQAQALAEIDVSLASPDIAAIYSDIARLSGIPLPALIWRHLATYPGVLSEAWNALRPLYFPGLAQDAAWRTVRERLAGHSAGPDRAALAAAGLDEETISAYRRVLASYNRANPVNFIGVRLLLARSSDPRPPELPARGPSLREWTPPAPVVDLPPMVPVAAIPTPVRAQIDGLAVDPAIDRSRVVPSLYRHLVPWPALIRLIHDGLAPRIRSDEIPELRRAISSALQAEVDGLVKHVGPLPHLFATPGVREVLERFTGLIPEMIVVGKVLENALEPV